MTRIQVRHDLYGIEREGRDIHVYKMRGNTWHPIGCAQWNDYSNICVNIDHSIPSELVERMDRVLSDETSVLDAFPVPEVA